MIQPKIMRDRERERETDRKRENEREREWGLPCCACLHVPGSLAYHRVHNRGQNKKVKKMNYNPNSSEVGCFTDWPVGYRM